jgi:hypothetical protein
MGPPLLAFTRYARTLRTAPQIGRQRPERERDGNKSTIRNGAAVGSTPPPRPHRSFSRAPRKAGAKPTPARHVAVARPRHQKPTTTASENLSSLIALRSCYKNERFGARLTTVTCSSWPRLAAHAHGAIVPQLIRRRRRPPPSRHGVPSAVQRRLCYLLQLLRLSARGPFPVRYGGAAGRLRVPVGRRRQRRPGSCTWCVRAAATAAYAGRARRPRRCRLQ